MDIGGGDKSECAMRAVIDVLLFGMMIMASCMFHDVKHVTIVDDEKSVLSRSTNVAQ
jgi:hypothetical protein